MKDKNGVDWDVYNPTPSTGQAYTEHDIYPNTSTANIDWSHHDTVTTTISTYDPVYKSRYSKTYCTCKKCGYDKAEVDMSVVYTSMPPKVSYKCPKCGETGYTYNAYNFQSAELLTKPKLSSCCIICGNETNNNLICDECKEAIKWVKEQKQGWHEASELTKAQEEMGKLDLSPWLKPYWCDQPYPCAECKKAVECAERYNSGK